jgi:outer membrane protein assembly factor BamB
MAHGNVRFVRRFALLAALALGASVLGVAAPGSRGGDWPQWRGVNRDGKATDFKVPQKWPEKLTKKWSVEVGDGVGTPALADGKLYVFTRQGGAEVVRCLNAESGKEVWKEKYDAEFKGKADSGYSGPRSSPAVADGTVVTFGVNGTLTARKASTGEKLWQVDTGPHPMFHTSCSPMIVDKTVIIQVGTGGEGGVTAYDLANGDVKWKWTDDGTAYSSPVAMTVGTTKMVVAETEKNIVAIGLKDGKTLWKTPFPLMGKGPGGGYNAATPMVNGQTVIFSGSNRGTKAIKIEKKGDSFDTKDFWSNKENSVGFNTPVLKNGYVYGLAGNDNLFCVNAETGKTAWTHELVGVGGRLRGYGSVVDAGSVLMALNLASKLVVFEPNEKEFKEVMTYKVADTETYAYPIVTENRIYIKDKNSVTLWTVEEK